MAVIITSKFYQESEWKDISKVVFTSPNMDSPSIAGTRSHILPGEGALGTWYEDTSEMFRIEDHQWTTDSDFYNYRMTSKDEVDLQAEAGYIDVKNLNYDGFDVYIKENTGVEIVGYNDNTGFISEAKTRLEYTPIHKNLDEIHVQTDTKVVEVILREYEDCIFYDPLTEKYVSFQRDVNRNYGWYTPVIAEFPNCYITFTFEDPTKVTAVEMSCIELENRELTWDYPDDTLCDDIEKDPTGEVSTTSKYFIGNYVIKGSNDESSWTTIYTGANDTNLTKFIYLSNAQYYKYYRLDITNNSSLNQSTFDRAYYGVRNLRFYTYDFSTDAGSENIALYEFNDLDSPKIVKISNAYPQEATTPTDTVTNDDNDIVGTMNINHTTLSGVIQSTEYIVALHGNIDPYDYLTDATCLSPTASGLGEDEAASTYAKEDKINVTCDATAEYLETVGPEYDVYFTAQGSQVVPVDTVDWVGDATITYTTVASGTVTSGTSYANLSGYTTRTEEASLYSRRESFRLVIDEYTTNSGIIAADEPLFVWGYNERFMDMDVKNSIVFEVTTGEAYNCRLTAWDDVTHSTTINELIQGDHVRCSCMAYCAGTSALDPSESKDPLNLVYPPAHNRIFKGNVDLAGYKYFYGDFDLVYRYQADVYGDYLIFKPMLYGIDTDISYGIHDYIITLHYSYT